ncbi:MAG: DNA-3-methyladenine glycosylase I [Anaerolineales bacterium]|nr:DNA-3-methyladenine glycosylase I [Anaerolineales bacterium]WKZ41236.1 MAG: DNA-3-methyladenine glycosylase I [Anaerolineales bacterium]
MIDYTAVFERIESSLIIEGSKYLSTEIIRENLNRFKQIEGKKFLDNEFYLTIVDVIFYSGFRASTVNSKIDTIHKHFPDYEVVADYSESDINNILADKDMIRNRRKVESCVKNAKIFRTIIQKHGSFQKYIDEFEVHQSFENLFILKEELENRFSGLGKITVYHFLTDIGLPVLKPDRVICRIFERLGLISSREQYLEAIIQGRKFAEATGYPIRYIDIVFVAYGQVQSREFGIERGICLETNPSCHLCGAKKFCNYYSQQSVKSTAEF